MVYVFARLSEAPRRSIHVSDWKLSVASSNFPLIFGWFASRCKSTHAKLLSYPVAVVFPQVPHMTISAVPCEIDVGSLSRDPKQVNM